MKKSIFIFILAFIFIISIFVLAYATPAYSQINLGGDANSYANEINELFGNNEEIEVIVVLKDDYNVLNEYGIKSYGYKDDFEMKKMMIEKQQENVLSDLKLKKKGKVVSMDKGVSMQSDEDYEFDLTNTYTTVNGFAGKLKKGSYEKLRNNPKVARIYKLKKVSALLSDSAKIINATRVWSLIYSRTNITGKGESICVIDTGVDYTHPALGGCSTSSFTSGACPKVINGYDFVNSDNDPVDDNGHGTHVAGIAASNDTTYKGTAPDATIVAMKTLDASGSGSTANLISSIDWCVNNASRFNISVISMSLGSSGYKNTTYCDTSDDPLLVDAIHNAINKNISVVVAAGNDGVSPLGVSSPACISNVTIVGSTTKADAVSSFSDRWGLPMLFAPGSSINSTKNGGGFQTFSGTSMAAPHAAGAFALLRQYKRLEQNVILTPAQIQDALNDTGKQINDSSGSGLLFSRINIFSALLSLDTTAPNITFVEPTPANNSNISSSSFIINITSNEVLSNAILEFNSTNETINATPIQLNWAINKTPCGFGSFGVFNYRLYANDSAGNMQITPTFQISINNTAPNITSSYPNESIIISEPDNLTFNISMADINGGIPTSVWYQNGTQKSTLNNFTFLGSFSSAGFYNITAVVSDCALETSFSWNLTVFNPAPNITSANLTSTDFLNRTNGTLQAFWSFSDLDEDNITANETLWYINNTLITNYTNKTTIHPINTTKLENWTFSVRVFDGSDWSGFMNSSTIRILNSQPLLNITQLSIAVLETQLANISLNASDLDSDAIAFTSNKSDFSVSGSYLLWSTNLSSSGAYAVNITANDTEGTDSIIVNVTVYDARDLDGDGNPDFNDSDIDNDGIQNNDDYAEGNISSINTTLSLGMTINGSSNFSKLFNGTFAIIITIGSDSIMEFNFTFNSSSVLDFGNLTINRTINGSGAVSIRGNLNLFNYTKTVFLEKRNATAKSVCIKDADAGFDSISPACDSANETLVSCSNATSGQYACFDTGLRYKVTGLRHSAVKEQCRDNDGDGYGTGCAAGDDCDDNDASKTASCSSGSSSSGGGGSSGGGSGGGGGGGGGSGAFFVCNMDWKCSEWSVCSDGTQKRQCDFVKVAQHVQETACPSSSSRPLLIQICEIAQRPQQLAQQSKAEDGVCNDNIKNQNEEGIDCGGACKPCPITQEISEKQKAISPITGLAVNGVSDAAKTASIRNVYLALAILLSISSLLFYIKFSHKRLIMLKNK